MPCASWFERLRSLHACMTGPLPAGCMATMKLQGFSKHCSGDCGPRGLRHACSKGSLAVTIPFNCVHEQHQNIPKRGALNNTSQAVASALLHVIKMCIFTLPLVMHSMVNFGVHSGTICCHINKWFWHLQMQCNHSACPSCLQTG